MYITVYVMYMQVKERIIRLTFPQLRFEIQIYTLRIGVF